jgi:hypothetical protein
VIGVNVQIYADEVNRKKACAGRQSMCKAMLQLLHEVVGISAVCG